METFLSSRDGVVTNAIDGLIASSGGALCRFPHESAAKIVARTDCDRSKVAIISGGGSGHEPAHAGFVGSGMLTAAVCGEIFASPSVDAVLAAIVAMTGSGGCLLIVKNYTGDRLNFGLAAEKAKSLGHQVEMVIVADDIAIPDAVQPRGLAGTLFLHKLAGFMSERGDPLDQIASAVGAASKRLYTIAAARDGCTIPGNERSKRLLGQRVEIGLGIHGEPGFEVSQFVSCENLVEDLARTLERALPETPARYALLFNNLGGLSAIEAMTLFAIVNKTPLAAKVDLLVGPAPLMTALDMPGFSLTMFELDSLAAEALRAPVGPAFWPGTSDRRAISCIDHPQFQEPASKASDDKNMRAIVAAVARACIQFEDEINALDAKVGDGDTGSTFAAAGKLVLERIDTLPLQDGSALFQALSKLMTHGIGGSSGVLFAILFAGAAEHFARSHNWPQALSHGLQLVQKYGGAQLGDRTMVDALKPALDAYEAGANLALIAQKAREGAARTASMPKAKAGRSSYLNSDSLIGTKDPGAAAIAGIFEALANNLEL